MQVSAWMASALRAAPCSDPEGKNKMLYACRF